MHALHYSLTPSDPKGHYFTVRLEIAKPSARQTLSLPSWIAGSYMLRDFAKNLLDFTAMQAGKTLAYSRPSNHAWEVDCTEHQPLHISYRVYAWDLSVRTAHLDESHGFFNGTSVFLRVEGQADRPHSVEIVPPQGEAYASWRLASSLTRDSAEPWGFGTFSALNYTDLVDHPVEMGDFQSISFEVEGVAHHLVISGVQDGDLPRMAADLAKICAYQIRFFGLPAPMNEYFFLTQVVGDGYGGLEHRASTALLCFRDDLAYVGMGEATEAYLRFLELCSHEYFHTWNVKRIQPLAYQHSDQIAPALSVQLWAFEGFTSYYDALCLVRTGLMSHAQYLKKLAQTLTRYQRTPGRLHQTLTESSWDAWTKFYKADENAPNAIISYYLKGEVVALCLDGLLRSLSAGQISLDTLLKKLWTEFGATGMGLDETAIEREAVALGEQAAGASGGAQVRAFLDQALYATEDLDLPDLLVSLGLTAELSVRTSAEDSGRFMPFDAQKTPASPLSQPSKAPICLGTMHSTEETGVLIKHVINGSPAHQAGISAGDRLIALNGLALNRQFTLENKLARLSADQTLVVHLFRRDELMTTQLTLAACPPDTWVLQADVNDPALSAWLGRH